MGQYKYRLTDTNTPLTLLNVVEFFMHARCAVSDIPDYLPMPAL